jgi:sulfonate transport system substrate-binding protein
LVAAACGAASQTASAGGSTSLASSQSTGGVLQVGDQQQNLQTLLKASGALAGASYKVNFVEFASGPLVDAGFAAHRIDIGFMGDLPASLAVRSGLPVKAVAVELPVGASEYLVAKPGVTSISQLRGKPVAYTTGTAEQAFALRALATAGLTQHDVHQVDVGLQQLGTAIESGSVDASVLSIEQKVDYQQTHPGATVLATIDKVQPASYLYFLGTTAALADPAKHAAIDDFTKRLLAATAWQKTHQSNWISAYYIDVEHQTEAAAKLILAAGGTSNLVPITNTVQAALQNVVSLLAGAGAIPAGYSVAPLFDPLESQRYNAILRGTTQNG